MFQLLAHQQKALDALIARNGRMLLWGDPGIGKTAIALKAAERVIERHNQPVLFICPSIVKKQVLREAGIFIPKTSVYNLEGSPEERQEIWHEILSRKEASVVIVNYEQLLVEEKTILYVPWDMIIIDECHRAKSPTSKQVKIIKKMKRVPFRLAMSGTPAPNALHEFYSMIDWVAPGILGDSFYEFRKRWCKTNPFIPQQITGYYDEPQLRKVIGEQIYRIRKEEVLSDIKEFNETTLVVPTTAEERERYSRLKNEMILELKDKQLTVPNALSCLMRLRQIVDCPRIFGLEDVSSKEAAVRELIKKWLTIPNSKILVFTELAEVAKFIKQDVPLCEMIIGETTKTERNNVLKKFTDGDARVLVGSSAIQTGLNIQAATHIIHVGTAWNQANMDQRNARAHRKGVKHAVESCIVLSEKTIDEYMYKLCKEKSKLSAGDLFQILNH